MYMYIDVDAAEGSVVRWGYCSDGWMAWPRLASRRAVVPCSRSHDFLCFRSHVDTWSKNNRRRNALVRLELRAKKTWPQLEVSSRCKLCKAPPHAIPLHVASAFAATPPLEASRFVLTRDMAQVKDDQRSSRRGCCLAWTPAVAGGVDRETRGEDTAAA